jgi:hypothetical protein
MGRPLPPHPYPRPPGSVSGVRGGMSNSSAERGRMGYSAQRSSPPGGRRARGISRAHEDTYALAEEMNGDANWHRPEEHERPRDIRVEGEVLAGSSARCKWAGDREKRVKRRAGGLEASAQMGGRIAVIPPQKSTRVSSRAPPSTIGEAHTFCDAHVDDVCPRCRHLPTLTSPAHHPSRARGHHPRTSTCPHPLIPTHTSSAPRLTLRSSDARTAIATGWVPGG